MSPLVLDHRSRKPLEVSPPSGTVDPLVERALKKMVEKAQYANAVRKAESLIRDEGLTLDIERLRDRVERRFGGLERLLLSRPGVLHRLLLDALEADDLQKAEDEREKRRQERQEHRDKEAAERREREQSRDERHEESLKTTQTLIQTLADVMASNQRVLEALLGRGDGAEGAAAGPAVKSSPATDKPSTGNQKKGSS
ncbi:hypothetical protein [Ornithinimicrobium sufpigmenti]|uniref:hypothetical protein n=1 Tax=Ornithinimicrobium sufpigmenti TaxID=2508882 RepID=UPI00103580BD|nr:MULTISPECIES: hypothetical protein [unclassified Ornithinimicrobium]